MVSPLDFVHAVFTDLCLRLPFLTDEQVFAAMLVLFLGPTLALCLVVKALVPRA